MADFRFDEAGLMALLRGPKAKEAVAQATDRIWSRASSMSSGFRSGYYFDERKGHVVGGTYARYGHDTVVTRNGATGLVWTGNYAAILDNARNNTLLKAR